MFTEVEGTWDEVFGVVKRATEAVEPFGSRVSLVIKADIRPGYEGELDAKVERLEQAIPDAGVHARAAVGDTKQQASTVDLRRDDDLAACGRVLDRVQDQIVEGALQL